MWRKAGGVLPLPPSLSREAPGRRHLTSTGSPSELTRQPGVGPSRHLPAMVRSGRWLTEGSLDRAQAPRAPPSVSILSGGAVR